MLNNDVRAVYLICMAQSDICGFIAHLYSPEYFTRRTALQHRSDFASVVGNENNAKLVHVKVNEPPNPHVYASWRRREQTTMTGTCSKVKICVNVMPTSTTANDEFDAGVCLLKVSGHPYLI